MKRTIITILLVLTAQSLFAQQEIGGSTATDEKQVVTATRSEETTTEKTELRAIVLRILHRELALTDEQFEIFAPLYGEYRDNIGRGLASKPRIEDTETASGSELNALLTANLDNYIHIAMVRKVYIPIFEKVLTPKQVYKLYEIDNELSKKAYEELCKRRKKN